MTIFNPSQQRNKIKFFVYFLLVFLIGGTFLVLEYNSLAGLRAEEKVLKNNIGEMQVVNAELKSELYEITDAQKLEEIAVSSGLVLDRSPKYITSK